jgi:hypothetical protein
MLTEAQLQWASELEGQLARLRVPQELFAIGLVTLRLQQTSSSSNRVSSSDGDLSDPVSFTRHALREVQEVPRMSQLAGPPERASLDEVLQVARRGGA